jgi:hypothetical protein
VRMRRAAIRRAGTASSTGRRACECSSAAGAETFASTGPGALIDGAEAGPTAASAAWLAG